MTRDFDDEVGADLDEALKADHVQRTPCVLVLDTSGSMASDGRIEKLNSGLRRFEQTIKGTEQLRKQVLLLVIGFGESVELLADWTQAEDFTAPKLVPSGMTPMGQAMRYAHSCVEDISLRLRSEGITFTRPWIFLMSDGGPNDEGWEEAALDSRRACEERRATVWPLAVPPGADGEKLHRFARTDMKVFTVDDDFAGIFEWLVTTLGQVVQSTPGQGIQITEPGPVYFSVDV